MIYYCERGGDKVKISVKIDRLQNDPNSALKAFASVTLDECSPFTD